MSPDLTKNPESHDGKATTNLNVDVVEPSPSWPNKSFESDVSESQRGRHLNLPPPPKYRVGSPDTLSIVSAEEASRLREEPIPASWSNQSLEQIEPPRTRRGKIAAWFRRVWARDKGVLLVLLAQVFGTLMNITAQILEIEGNNGKGLNPFQVLFARMSITTLLSSAYMWWQRIEGFPLGPRGVRWILVARGIGGFFGVFGMYYSLLYLPLADATVITFLAPSLACFACSVLIHEPFTGTEKIGALVSFIGVVLIARPATLFSSGGNESPGASGTSDMTVTNGTSILARDETNHGTPTDVTPTQRAAAVGVAFVGVLGAASAYTTMRWIGNRAHPLLSVNYFSAWCLLVSTVVLSCVPSMSFSLPANLREWGLLGSLGVCGFVMQFLLAAGLQAEKSSRATNMVYTQMLFALAFDKLVWGTTPGVMSIAGSSLILGSAVVVAMKKQSGHEAQETQEQVDEERGLLEENDEEEHDALELLEHQGTGSEDGLGDLGRSALTPIRESEDETRSDL